MASDQRLSADTSTATSPPSFRPDEALAVDSDNKAMDSEKNVASSDNGTPFINERRLMWKIDLHLVPPLCILYLLAFLDRVNIANAKLYNLTQDLNLVGNQYNICLVLFFVPYIICEIPANVLLKKFRPSIWLPSIMFCFGLVMTLQGLVQNFSGLAATRFFLGLCEAGAFPGCFYLLSMWYKRTEAQKRFSFFFSSTTLAGAFGGLLASAIGLMNGIRGYSAWRWIFILEGIATCVISLFGFWFISDFPEEAKFLTEPERQFVIAKLQKDIGNSAYEDLTWKKGLEVFKDWKVWVGGLMYISYIVGAYGYAYFSPTIISSLGYVATRANLMSVPPWAAAFAFAMFMATASDYLAHRYIFALIPTLIAIIGFAVLVSPSLANATYYGALFLAAAGSYTAMPIVVCWYNTNLGGHTKRSVGSAWQIGFGNIGGIIATYVFLSNTAPRFVLGKSVCIGFLGMGVLVITGYWAALRYENWRRDRRQGLSAHEDHLSVEEMSRLGDGHPDFRFIL